MVSLHAENNGVRIASRSRRLDRRTGGGELPGSAGDSGVVNLHEDEDGFGSAKRTVGFVGCGGRAVVFGGGGHSGGVRVAVCGAGLHPWSSPS